MGLTHKSTGTAVNEEIVFTRRDPDDIVVALAGNPNVGKSTVFNALTGMNQHTGNWPGKTVSNATGECRHKGRRMIFVDLPGTYSLMADSTEEEIARDFICFGGADVIVVVADATCLERNLNLVLQTAEIHPRVILCVNLMDEAEKKGIVIDIEELRLALGIPVICTAARAKKGLPVLLDCIEMTAHTPIVEPVSPIRYEESLEHAITDVAELLLAQNAELKLPVRWLALKHIDGDEALCQSFSRFAGFDPMEDIRLAKRVAEIKEAFAIEADTGGVALRDRIVSSIVRRAEEIARACITYHKKDPTERDRRIDRILTARATGIPIMLLLLCGIFWLTIEGANYPSQLLSSGLEFLREKFYDFCLWITLPHAFTEFLVNGVCKTLSSVIAVMLPPMAIFFPLFTILEDLGYLPRVAFNLDKSFRRCGASGKQALTMCMGFGCNACGVIGCRIINSRRESLIAVLTNNFVPCNGRFPTLIAVISMFFVVGASGIGASLLGVVLLAGVVVLGIGATFLASKILSKTVLRGEPSAFSLELPPYRVPQFSKVIVRSVLDRTLFVLGRAVSVAVPAGAIIWLFANIDIGGVSILTHAASFFDPFAALMGIDGVILLAFLLGFPANEIVMPIILMAYMSTGVLTDYSSLAELRMLLVEHGWNFLTALNMLIITLFHFPCGTTCITIYKETRSVRMTAISILMPTLLGIALTMLTTLVYRLIF